jgi:HK97 family phage major capsid protein
MTATATEIKSLEDLRSAFLDHHRELKSFVDKANAEIENAGKASTETKNAIDALTQSLNGTGERIDGLEARLNRRGEGEPAQKSLGERFIESAEGKSFMSQSAKSARLEVKAIINATGQNQPLVPAARLPGVVAEPNRMLRLRDFLPSGVTSSNLIEYAQENVFTNNAGPQFDASPGGTESQLKNESNITFTLATAPVITLAHFILASRQVHDDAPMLASYIDGRLMYGLKLEEEDELLNGTGASGQLNGLLNQATAYTRGATNDTAIDTLRKAQTQLAQSEYSAEVYVLNPADWEAVELTKDSQGRYIFANPQSNAAPALWSRPVVATNSMPAGSFLCANLSQAAQIWDRQAMSVEASREDSDNFRRNMVTLLAEERIGLAVYRPAALITGAL